MKKIFLMSLVAAVMVPMAHAAVVTTNLEKTVVREKAAMTAKVLTTLPAGVKVETGKTSGAFTEVTVTVDGKKLQGFVATANLQSVGSKASNLGTGEMKKSGYSSADIAAAVKGATKFDAATTGADPNAKTNLPEGSEDPAAAQVDRLEKIEAGEVSPGSDFVRSGKLQKPAKAGAKAP